MKEKIYIYTKAANGLMVRIPEDRYEEWKKRQDEIRAGKRSADPEMVRG